MNRKLRDTKGRLGGHGVDPLTVGIVLVGIAALGGLCFLSLRGRSSQSGLLPGAQVASEGSGGDEAKAAAQSPLHRLVGRWLRPDGGYVLEIVRVEAGGKLEARYLNPRSIFVSRAEARAEGETVKLFVELQDEGYPGSNYSLSHSPSNDVLSGVYYQAAIRESFDVEFTRMP